jgi:hypothetical protein
MRSNRIKDALGRAGNVTLSEPMDVENRRQVDDEYCHAHSGHLRKIADRLEKQAQDRRRITEFANFVSPENSRVLPAIEAILTTGTHGYAAGFLGISDAGFTRMRNRLSQLGRCFVDGEPVPRQREPYKERMKTRIVANILAA